METASSPRMGADVTPEQQRKHEQLADRARERAVVRNPTGGRYATNNIKGQKSF